MAKIYTSLAISIEVKDYAKAYIEEQGYKIVKEGFANRHDILGANPNSTFAIMAEEMKLYWIFIVEQEVERKELEYKSESVIDLMLM